MSTDVPQVSARFGGFFLTVSDWVPEWLAMRPLLMSPALQSIGAALTIIGCSFAIWARLALGTNWSGRPTVKAEHKLVVTGPYAFARHPIYTGILVATIGTALADLEWRRGFGAAIWRIGIGEGFRHEALLLADFH
jgi:protein-S-isoprenylcysteine O-methyltransferase Ste14